MSMRNLIRLIPAGLLGLGAALLVSCGSSGKGLIPLAYAGPLQSDFQAVLQAAQEGDGSCTATEAKIRKTEHDLHGLPASVDGGLRGRLAEGVANLAVRAHTMCAQPLTPTTTTSTTPTSPPATSTTPPATSSAPSTTTPPTGATPESSEPPSEEGGATRAPGTGNDEGRGTGEAQPESEQEAAGGVEAGEIGANGGTGSGR
jgi:septal ring-binding cell division protein DamX